MIHHTIIVDPVHVVMEAVVTSMEVTTVLAKTDIKAQTVNIKTIVIPIHVCMVPATVDQHISPVAVNTVTKV